MKDFLDVYTPHARRWLEAEYSNEYSDRHVESLAYLLVACRADGARQCEALEGKFKHAKWAINKAREALANYRGEIMNENYWSLQKTDALQQAVSLLQALFDLQNGPPLERRKGDWVEVMEQAVMFLGEMEKSGVVATEIKPIGG